MDTFQIVIKIHAYVLLQIYYKFNYNLFSKVQEFTVLGKLRSSWIGADDNIKPTIDFVNPQLQYVV